MKEYIKPIIALILVIHFFGLLILFMSIITNIPAKDGHWWNCFIVGYVIDAALLFVFGVLFLINYLIKGNV